MKDLALIAKDVSHAGCCHLQLPEKTEPCPWFHTQIEIDETLPPNFEEHHSTRQSQHCTIPKSQICGYQQNELDRNDFDRGVPRDEVAVDYSGVSNEVRLWANFASASEDISQTPFRCPNCWRCVAFRDWFNYPGGWIVGLGLFRCRRF